MPVYLIIGVKGTLLIIKVSGLTCRRLILCGLRLENLIPHRVNGRHLWMYKRCFKICKVNCWLTNPTTKVLENSTRNTPFSRHWIVLLCITMIEGFIMEFMIDRDSTWPWSHSQLIVWITPQRTVCYLTPHFTVQTFSRYFPNLWRLCLIILWVSPPFYLPYPIIREKEPLLVRLNYPTKGFMRKAAWPTCRVWQLVQIF